MVNWVRRDRRTLSYVQHLARSRTSVMRMDSTGLHLDLDLLTPASPDPEPPQYLTCDDMYFK